MANINAGRVVLGGLVAGLVINVGEWILNGFVLASAMEGFYERFNLSEPGTGAMVTFIVLGFIGGIVMLWLYAGIRPRFGPGPKTAAMAAIAVWVFAYLWPVVGFTVMGMFDTRPAIIALVWGIVEFVLAALAGGALYQEGARPAAAPQM